MAKMQTQDHIQPRKGRSKLIWRFLKGSKALFILSMICSAVASLSEMIVPQIIRVTVDNVIGGEPTDNLVRPVQSLLERFGGTEALRKQMWILALAVLVVAAVCALARYEFRVSNAKASERLVKTMRDTLFGHIELR